MPNKTGVLLINLGSPDSPTVPDVRRYLRQFLSDPRVLDAPFLIRQMVLNLFILPFRPKNSAEAYSQIWQEDGSPLIIHTRNLTDRVRDQLGDGEVIVDMAMRYGNPSIPDSLERFSAAGVERLIVLPLYPQYAASSTGSCIEELYRVAGAMWNTPSLTVIPPFYDHPGYLDCLAAVTRESMGDPDQYDMLLMSFHGLPERHVRKCDLSGRHCLEKSDCCSAIVDDNRYCYRAQCYVGAQKLAERLGIAEDRYLVTFQSRLGRDPWIRPYTDIELAELPKRGVKRLAVMISSFTADCLETIEEIGIRGREIFTEAGGDHLHLIPCLNDHPQWVEVVTDMIRGVDGSDS